MQDSILTKAPLGWGIIGTPAGYQYAVQGVVESQLKCAQHWDLDTQIAVVLPEADLKLLEPLYGVSFKSVNNVPVIAVMQYLSTHQQVGNRSGTFFGSFVEAAGHWFSSKTAGDILESLRQLSGYQLQNFIDFDKNTYIQDIKNQPFNSPREPLENVASGLQKNTVPLRGTKVLVIDTSEIERGELILLSSLLATPYLATEFNAIYFSSSKSICEKFKTLSDVQYITGRGFKTYLSMFNQQLMERKKLTTQISSDRANFEQETTELKNVIMNYEQNLAKMNEQTKLELQQKFDAEIVQKEQSIEYLNTQLEVAETAQKNSQRKSELFDQLSQFILENSGGEQQQKIKELIHQNNALNQQLEQSFTKSESLKQANRQLQSELNNERNRAATPDYGLLKKLSVFRWGTIISTALLAISIGGMIALISAKSDYISKSQYDLALKKEKDNSKKLEDETKKAQENADKIKRDLESAKNDLKDLCKNPPKGRETLCYQYK